MNITAATSRILFCAILAAAAFLQGCATTPSHSLPPIPVGAVSMPPPGAIEASIPSPAAIERSLGSEVVIRAISLLGTPYKFGGSGPLAFDCSGLIQFVYDEVGIDVPRTAAEQFRAVMPVKRADLEPGDLVFFKPHGSRVSHVGIYAGSNRFVHAPRAGRPVELRDMDDKYYSRRFAGAGRVVEIDLLSAVPTASLP